MRRALMILVVVLWAGVASGQTAWLEDGDVPAYLPGQNTIGPGALSTVGGALANDPSDVDRNAVPLVADEPAGPRDGGGPRDACCGDTILGTGTGTTPLYPLDSNYNYYRSMSLIKRSELTCDPNRITQFAIQIATAKTTTFTNVEIRMKKTTLTGLTGAWDGSGDLVWGGPGVSTQMTPTGWKTFVLTAPFNWDSDNLLITWQWNGTKSTNRPYYNYTSSVGFPAQAYGGSASAFPTTLSYASNRANYRLTIVPAVLTGACCYHSPTIGCSTTDQAGCTALGGSWYMCQDCDAFTCPPWNDNCGAVTPVALADGVPQTFTGDNTIATNDCALFAGGQVWHAITLPNDENYWNVTLDYCGTSPAFGDAWRSFAISCPCSAQSAFGTSDTTTCGDNNYTIRWLGLPTGTYYYPVKLDEVLAQGPYTIHVVANRMPTGACCISVTPWCLADLNTAECLAAWGTYQGDGQACDPGLCPKWGACCKGYESDPRCVIVKDESTCRSTYMGDWMGEETTCDAITCPPLGACCRPSTGSCYIRSQYYCNYSDYVWLGPDITTCTPNPCPQPTGACCLGETCEVLEQAACLAQSGTYVGDWEPCTTDKCKTGACCFSTGGCLELVNWYCSSYTVLGTFMGPGTTCYPSPCLGFPTDWSDNFDSYDNGTLLYHVGGWTGRDDVESRAGTVSNAQARSVPHSIMVNGTADAIHPFAPVKAGGYWEIRAWQYIPSGLSGTSYFIVNSFYQHGGPYFTMIKLRFDPVSGKVWDDLHTGCTTGLPLVYDQWVELVIVVDFAPSLGTVYEYYNSQLLCSGDWVLAPVGQKAIANIELYAPHGTPVYYDEMSVVRATAAPHPTVPLFVGCESTTTIPTRTTDLTGFPDVTWNDGFQDVAIAGAAGRADGCLYLADASLSDRYLYLAPFQGPAIRICRHASGFRFSALAYGRGKLYGYKNTPAIGIYEIDPATCATTLRLDTSPHRYLALDYNRVDGLLYGYDQTYGSPTGLYKINIDAGTQTWVAGNIPGGNIQMAASGMAIGDNKVYLVPDNQSIMYVWDLSTAGPWVAMTHPYSSNPGGTGCAAWVTLPKPGDMNCDGVVDIADIAGFALALVDAATYSSTAPGWDCTLLNADVNLDGARNGQDVAPFVQLLIGA